MSSTDLTERLEGKVAAEAAAYGYTLSIWGAGALVVSRVGLPGVVGVFAYIMAAVVGFAAVLQVAVRGVTSEFEADAGGNPRVVSAVHVGATGGNLLVSYMLVVAVAGLVPKPAVFALVGFQATVLYNLLISLEEEVAARVA